jgi:hypothetical protein
LRVQPARADTIGAGMDAFAHQHYTRSTSTFMRRAKLGQAIAQTYLGYMCANGLGAPQNFFHEVTSVKVVEILGRSARLVIRRRLWPGRRWVLRPV